MMKEMEVFEVLYSAVIVALVIVLKVVGMQQMEVKYVFK